MLLSPAFSAFIARERVSRWALRIATVIDRPLMRLSGGRLRLSFVIPVLLLRVRGARTGAPREIPLLYAPVDAAHREVLLVASNGGQARHPAWYHNLLAQPHVRVLFSTGERAMTARLLSGAERDKAFAVAVAIYPGYRVYAQRCERVIPVFRLSPAAGDTG